MWKQIESEMKMLESQLTPHAKKGKTIILTQVTRVPHTNSPRNSALRDRINKEYVSMAQRLKKSSKNAKAEVISWGIMTETDDKESTVKAIGEQATINYIQKIDEKLGSNKLRATYLDSKLTSYQYSQVTSTYPLGCYKCTQMEHTKESCTADFSRKRNASNELDEQVRQQAKQSASPVSMQNAD